MTKVRNSSYKFFFIENKPKNLKKKDMCGHKV